MRVLVDGRELKLSAGATLADALGSSGAYIAPGAIIGVVKGRGEKSRQTNSYWLNTSKGKLRIELLESELLSIWHESVDRISGSTVRWSSADGVAFGTFPSEISFSRDAQEYNRWEVVLGAAGFDRENTQIIFIRRRHTAAYGTPKKGGVVGHVVGGKNTLDRLAAGDRIESIEPIVEWQEITEKQATQDLSMALEEGMEIFTTVEAELDEDAPLGAEFFLALTRDGTLTVDAVSSSYTSSDMLRSEPMIFENREPRLEGAVTVRTAGRGLGRIFVYKKDRTSNPAHSAVARIISGMDMIKLASPGERITIKVRPERIMLLGKSLKDALSQMQSLGIQAQAEGYQGEDAVVVKQDPGATMAILKEKTVVLHSMPSSRLIAVKLYSDQAPKTLDYFRHVTGLKERPLGPLPVFFVYENTLLFKPDVDATSYKELLPENKPEGPVPAGSIAVSNTVSKKMGMVGVKLAEDKRYGPSGEKFEATNIIGRVMEPEKLRDVKEGETIYILEVR